MYLSLQEGWLAHDHFLVVIMVGTIIMQFFRGFSANLQENVLGDREMCPW